MIVNNPPMIPNIAYDGSRGLIKYTGLYLRIDNVVSNILPVIAPTIDPNDTNRVIAITGIDIIKHKF